MSSRNFLRIYLFLLLLLCAESYQWNYHPGTSLVGALESFGFLPEGAANPMPGRALSRALGWAGISFILLTNLYLVRKWILARGSGSANLKGWLNFHIFCGLIGATLIVFHTNFKVGGLVAVAFWSMIVCFASGIAGRYLYSFVAMQKAELAARVEKGEAILRQLLGERGDKLLGVWASPSSGRDNALAAVWRSLKTDFELLFLLPQLRRRIGGEAAGVAFECIRGRGRLERYEQFRKMMGYWHAFHRPFALFMYLVAVIHIATATLMKVEEAQMAHGSHRKSLVRTAGTGEPPLKKKIQRAGEPQ